LTELVIYDKFPHLNPLPKGEETVPSPFIREKVRMRVNIKTNSVDR
jgi:hypothetical protein